MKNTIKDFDLDLKTTKNNSDESLGHAENCKANIS